MFPLMAFYDEDHIGPDTCVIYTLEQAIRFHPYLAARSATPQDLLAMIEEGCLAAAVFDGRYYVSLFDLEAFVASGAFRHYGFLAGEFRCDKRLFWLMGLNEIGLVWASP
jgi:hypothetical protein